jgi:hypothetical protein
MAAALDAPAMARREIALWIADEKQGRHWVHTCWCDGRHDGTETGLTFVAPPWSKARRAETAG